MRPKELSVGNYVYGIEIEGSEDQAYGQKFHYPIQIETIYGDTILDNYGMERDIKDGIEPIPLTAEILEKNGFVEYAKDTWRYDIDEGVYIQADFTATEPHVYVSNRCYFACPYCEFFHQLQNAMSLCGIDKKIVDYI